MRLVTVAAIALAAVAAVAHASPYILETERMLAQLGYDPGKVDGEYDDQLTAAVIRFQGENRLEQTGLIDPQTHETLVAAVSPPSAQRPLASMPLPATAPASASVYRGTSARPAEEVIGSASQDRRRRFGVLIDVAAEFGGDKVDTIAFSDGSTQGVRAGQGLTLGGGLYFQPASLINLKATAGFKLVSTKASNANILLTRVVLKQTADLLLPAGFKLTGGAVEHLGINYDSDNFGNDRKFKDAVGFIVGAGWRWIGLGYTDLDYQDKTTGEKFDASNLGVTFSWEF